MCYSLDFAIPVLFERRFLCGVTVIPLPPEWMYVFGETFSSCVYLLLAPLQSISSLLSPSLHPLEKDCVCCVRRGGVLI